MIQEDLYQVLGVARGATEAEIKKAYRKLARELHPDRNKGNKSFEERFKKVSAAYAVLSDKEKRKLYDEFGIDGLRDGFDPQMWRQYAGQGSGRGPRPAPGGGKEADFGGFSGFGDLQDIFENLFGGRGGGGVRFNTQTRGDWPFGDAPFGRAAAGQDGPSVRSELEVDMQDALRGRELQIALPVNGGQRKLNVVLPQGIDSGQTIRLKGQGGRSPSGGADGDLLLEIKIRPDAVYQRHGLDLSKKESVTLGAAYFGGALQVDTPWGKVTVNVPEGTQSGQKLRLRGKGVKRGQEKGDLYVEIAVKVPTRKTAEIRKLIEQLEKAYD